MGLSFAAGSRTIAWLTVLAVLVVGVVDWLQGSPPDGVLDLGDAVGLALFTATACGVAVSALVIGNRSQEEPAVGHWAVVVALATLASAIADPTYAVLLFAVPLVHIARRWSDPARRGAIVGIFLLAALLVALEDQSWSGNDLEATMVLFIALLLTTILGYVLGRLDTALQLESDLARLDEREQLAGELHDSVGHSLLASSIQLRNARALWDADTDGARRSVELASRAVDDALVDTRIAVDTVRSRSERFSLLSALPELIDRITSPSLAVELTVDGDVEAADQLTQITLYRVAQEALTNVVRHADASTVRVGHSRTPTETGLTITDDGRGFDVDANTATPGLRGLEERLHRIGGALAVESTGDGGTTLTATVSNGR
ncbi:MAG: sensor histidine kinase [Actinomycetota bacterium]